jgi:hypothetical protein
VKVKRGQKTEIRVDKKMIKTLKCTPEKCVIGESVMTTDENIELMPCNRAEEDEHPTIKTKTKSVLLLMDDSLFVEIKRQI